jgi:hypothetical protein
MTDALAHIVFLDDAIGLPAERSCVKRGTTLLASPELLAALEKSRHGPAYQTIAYRCVECGRDYLVAEWPSHRRRHAYLNKKDVA